MKVYQDFVQLRPIYADTLEFFKKEYQGLSGGHSLENLTRYFLGRAITHDALQDARDLKEVCWKARLDEARLIEAYQWDPMQ